mgnify:CR=1 FL=1
MHSTLPKPLPHSLHLYALGVHHLVEAVCVCPFCNLELPTEVLRGT